MKYSITPYSYTISVNRINEIVCKKVRFTLTSKIIDCNKLRWIAAENIVSEMMKNVLMKGVIEANDWIEWLHSLNKNINLKKTAL